MVNHKQIAVVLAIGLVVVLMTSASTRVFAQHSGNTGEEAQPGKTVAGHEEQAGKVLAGHDEEMRMLFPEVHQIGCIIDHLAGRPC